MKRDILGIIETYHRFNILTQERIINLTAETADDGDDLGVSRSMSNPFLKNLAILESINKDPITIIHNTDGGSEDQGMAIYDAIKASKCHITIKVYGSCMSMGTIILQAADERVLTPNCMIMFHDGTSGSVISNHAEAANSARFFEQYGKKLDDILYARINEKRTKDDHAPMSRKTFDMMSLKGKYIFPQEAVELGIADRIDDGSVIEES